MHDDESSPTSPTPSATHALPGPTDFAEEKKERLVRAYGIISPGLVDADKEWVFRPVEAHGPVVAMEEGLSYTVEEDKGGSCLMERVVDGAVYGEELLWGRLDV